MGIARIGLADDAVEREVDPDRFTRAAHALVDRAGAVRAAELGLEIFPAVDAFAREVRVELERMPAYGGTYVRQPCERLVETALAHKAPRTDHVRHDIDDELIRFRHHTLLR